MSKKKEKGIEIIKKGRIDFYYPLKIETTYSFEELCNKLQKNIYKDIDKYESQICDSLIEKINSLDKDIHARSLKKLDLKDRLYKRFLKNKKSKNTVEIPSFNGGKIGIQPTDRGALLDIIPPEIVEFYERFNYFASEYKQNKAIYGDKFVNSHMRFLLPPMSIKLINDEPVWLHAILFVFENKMSFLKIELPLINVSTDKLKNNEAFAYIKSITDVWGILPVADTTLESLCKSYINRIKSLTGIYMVPQARILGHTILCDYSGRPDKLDNISNEVQEDLYRIIAAPIWDSDSISITKKSQEYIKNHTWREYGVSNILNNSGGCLTILDESTVSHYHSVYKKEYGVESLTIEDLNFIDNHIIQDMCFNTEFTLIILILKHIDSSYIYRMKLNKPKNIHNLHFEHDLNVMFISELQELCYGSVSEQIIAFEKMMPFYLKEDITTRKMTAIDNILSNEEKQRYNSLQNFLSVVGLIIALFFGLPAIQDTYKIVRDFFSFIVVDIPIVSLNNISLITWILLVITSCTNIILRIKSWKKRRFFDFK